jgi:hypothetical protein
MMSWEQLEKIFDRALSYSLCRKKNLFVIPVLVLCGLLVVLCRALAMTAGDWILLSLTFLPVFLSSGLLLAAGVVLIRVYSQDLKNVDIGFKSILEKSWQVLLNISYLSLPLLLAYLLLWTVMGVFYLLRELPALGDFISVILAFAPFLLILGSIILGLFNIVMLFFVTPVVALKTGVRLKLIEVVYSRLKQGIFTNCICLLTSVLPIGICLSILVLAAKITGASFFSGSGSLSTIFQWFFVMIPFAALLSPSVIFFFNFSTECFLLQKRKEVALKETV